MKGKINLWVKWLKRRWKTIRFCCIVLVCAALGIWTAAHLEVHSLDAGPAEEPYVDADSQNTSSKDSEDLSYEAVRKEDVPKELLQEIQKKKETPFRLTYEDGADLYIARGYGKKQRDGYQVEVSYVKARSSVIHIHTILKGAKENEKAKKKQTFPYVVIHIDRGDLSDENESSKEGRRIVIFDN